jgi:ABC-type methionine transport system ATPase subunit
MDLIGKLCDPVIVMAEGSVLTTGTMAEIRKNQEVIEAYLGHGGSDDARRKRARSRSAAKVNEAPEIEGVRRPMISGKPKKPGASDA